MTLLGPLTLRCACDGRWWALDERETGWALSRRPLPNPSLNGGGVGPALFSDQRDSIFERVATVVFVVSRRQARHGGAASVAHDDGHGSTNARTRATLQVPSSSWPR
jgi:hypothetical protein